MHLPPVIKAKPTLMLEDQFLYSGTGCERKCNSVLSKWYFKEQVSFLRHLYLKRDWFILAGTHSLVVNGKKPGRGYLPVVALTLIVGIQ